MKSLAFWMALTLASLLVGCSEDLNIFGVAWSCTDERECASGFVCQMGPNGGVCVEPTTAADGKILDAISDMSATDLPDNEMPTDTDNPDVIPQDMPPTDVLPDSDLTAGDMPDPDGKDGDLVSQDVPKDVEADTMEVPIVEPMVSVGYRHACAVNAYGRVYCWGDNEYLRVGSLETSNALPHRIELPRPAFKVAAGENHTCAAIDDSVWCWGQGLSGELGVGDGAPAQTAVPQPVKHIGRVLDIAAGPLFTCAIMAPGQQRSGIQCWGANDHGQVDYFDDQTFLVYEAREVTAIGTLEPPLTVGQHHVCAPEADVEAVRCWGSNEKLQLNIDGDTSSYQSRATSFGDVGEMMDDKILTVGGGRYHNCSGTQRADGNTRVWCWGENQERQADPLSGGQTLAVVVGASGFTNPTSVLSRGPVATSQCVSDGSKITCWGNDDSNWLSGKDTTEKPFVAFNEGAKTIALGERFGCFVSLNDEIKCFGENDAGQLGQGDTDAHTGANVVTLP